MASILQLKSDLLLEVSRKDLLDKSRRQSKQRFKKRLNYQVTNFRGVDLKELFENDYLVFKTPIKDYVCVIAFPGVFTQLRQVVKETHGNPSRITLQMVIKALRRAFDATDDIRVRCSCADFKYRFMYWADKNGYLYGPPDSGTEQFPDKTNPDDMLGATCKHLDMLLSNKRWVTKAASVVNSFIKTYPDKAALYLYDEDEIETPDDDEIVDDSPEEMTDDTSSDTQEENPQEISDENSDEQSEVDLDDTHTNRRY